MGYETNPSMEVPSSTTSYLSSGEEDSEEDEEFSGTMKRTPSTPSKPSNKSYSSEEEEEEDDDDMGSGTMVRRPKDTKKNESSTPAFMKHLQNKKNVTPQDVSIFFF